MLTQQIQQPIMGSTQENNDNNALVLSCSYWAGDLTVLHFCMT
jgi:hypothetical protein